MTAFDTLAENYDLGRIGYSNDIYTMLTGWGLAPTHRVLDVGAGTGIGSAPLINRGMHVTGVDPAPAMLEIAERNYPQATWVQGTAEALPFEAESFDAVVSAQALHHADRALAQREIQRVLRPGGIAAMWWKMLASDNPIRQLCNDAARDIGFEPPPRGGLVNGFKEFYAAGWAETALRVIPWRTAVPVARFMHYERSRKIVYDTFGSRADEYFETVEQRLVAILGDMGALVPLSYTHFLYLAKK
jgi:ubiquinone/menaquinone biosynthesis C-methylase UbiE